MPQTNPYVVSDTETLIVEGEGGEIRVFYTNVGSSFLQALLKPSTDDDWKAALVGMIGYEEWGNYFAPEDERRAVTYAGLLAKAAAWTVPLWDETLGHTTVPFTAKDIGVAVVIPEWEEATIAAWRPDAEIATRLRWDELHPERRRRALALWLLVEGMVRGDLEKGRNALTQRKR
ncbi:MAG: hypothetical protein AAB865_02535 [Patescibacteria group bacterium]